MLCQLLVALLVAADREGQKEGLTGKQAPKKGKTGGENVKPTQQAKQSHSSRIFAAPAACGLAVAAHREGHLQHPLLPSTVKAKNLVSIADALPGRPAKPQQHACCHMTVLCHYDGDNMTVLCHYDGDWPCCMATA